MKKVEKHELFGSPYGTTINFEKWYMSGRNVYDTIQTKTGQTNRNHCRLRDGGGIPYKYWLPSPVEPLSHRPSRGYYFSTGTHVLRMPKAIETIFAYDIKEMSAMNTLDVDVTVDVYLYHFRMYKTLFRSHLDKFKKRLLTTVTIPANEIVSLLSDFKLDNLDTDAFTIEVVPRELQFTHPRRFLGGGNVAGVHVTTSFTKSSTIHTKKTVRELYDLGYLGQGTDDTQPQPTQIVDGATGESALTNTSSANVSAFVSGSSQRPENIEVNFKEDELIVNVADQDFPLRNINRQIFDTKEGFYRQIVLMDNAEIVGKNDIGASVSKFFIATNEGFEQQINQLTARDLDSNINYTVRPRNQLGDSGPPPPPYVIEGDKKSNYISIWRIDDLIIIEDRRKDLVPDAKVRATLTKEYKTITNAQRGRGDLLLEEKSLSITFLAIGVFSTQLSRGLSTGFGFRQSEPKYIAQQLEQGIMSALREQDSGHYEYEVVVETLDSEGNHVGYETITLDSSVDRVPNIENSFAFDSHAKGKDDFWVKNRTATKTITLNKTYHEPVHNIAIKSSKAKLKSSTNWQPTEIAPTRNVFKVNGKDVADKPLTSVTNFTVTVIDGETSGKKTFRLSWVDNDEPSDDILYNIFMKGTSVVTNEEVGTVKTRNANRFFTVDKNATSFDIPEDQILGQVGSVDEILLTDDILDESRFEFTFRKFLEIDTRGRFTSGGVRRNATATSIAIYEGSEYSDARIQDSALITSSSDIYYQTKGLFYGVSYSPNLYYISKDKGENPYSFSGHGILNINLCDFYIVIKGRPQSDLKVDLYNSTTFVERSTDLHGSLMFWDGDNFDTFSFHGIKKESMWTVIKVPIKRHSGINRIQISSVAGGYTFDTGTLPFTHHPDYSFGYNTSLVQSRKSISVRNNWENNQGYSGGRTIIGDIDKDKTTVITTFSDDAKEGIRFVNRIWGGSSGFPFLNILFLRS